MAYGDVDALSEYAGAPITRPRNFDWQHGWIPSARVIKSPEQIVGSDGRSRFRKSWTYLVARDDQAAALRKFGYSSTHAIGLPIVYVPGFSERIRQPDSLLAVPHHSTDESNSSLLLHHKFANIVSGYSACYRQLSVLVHALDWNRGVQKIYESAGLTAIRGASENDVTSLTRIARILSTYETIVSNHLGSPIAYAAYLGAKVSIVGHYPVPNIKPLSEQVYYRNCIECIEEALRWESAWRSRPELAFLLREPSSAETAHDWGRMEVGADHKLTPEAVKDLFFSLNESSTQSTPRKLLHFPASLLSQPLKHTLHVRLKLARRGLKAIRRTRIATSFFLADGEKRFRNIGRFILGISRSDRRVRLSATKSAGDFEVRLRTSDFESVKQHFVRDDLKQLALDISSADIILDVGSHTGYSTLRMRALNSAARILVMENNWENIQVVRRNTARLQNVSVVYGSLVSTDDDAPLTEPGVSDWLPSEVSDDISTVSQSDTLQKVSWSQLMKWCNSTGGSVFLRFHVDESEAAIFSRLGEEILATCDAIVISIRDNDPTVSGQVLLTLVDLHRKFEFDMSEAGNLLALRNIVLAR
jgi:hypothetical protein